MALTLKNPQVEALVIEVAQLTGESKTEAVRTALQERRDRLQLTRGGPHKRDLVRFLETHVWPLVPKSVLGVEVTRTQVEDYLGYGPQGV